MLSGMCSRSKILAFLTISKDWDPSLLVVMFTAVFINLVTFQGIIWYGKPVFENRLQMPVNGVELGSFVGPAFFGIGWGITGLCPGPGIANLIVNPNCFLLIATIYAGQKLVDSMYEIASKFKKD